MAFRDDVDLKLLREFKPTHDWLLEPGDMLYLPPGVAHHGVAEGECLTFSVGMRAPAVAEMITDFAGFLAERMAEEWRYADAGSPRQNSGEIDGALERSTNAAGIVGGRRFGLVHPSSPLSYRTRSVPRNKPISKPSLRVAKQAPAYFNPWTRGPGRTARGATLFVAGEAHACSRNLALRITTRAALRT
jgi:50S ribosomal protein L16 3-hydroxylase